MQLSSGIVAIVSHLTPTSSRDRLGQRSTHLAPEIHFEALTAPRFNSGFRQHAPSNSGLKSWLMKSGVKLVYFPGFEHIGFERCLSSHKLSEAVAPIPFDYSRQAGGSQRKIQT